MEKQLGRTSEAEKRKEATRRNKYEVYGYKLKPNNPTVFLERIPEYDTRMAKFI